MQKTDLEWRGTATLPAIHASLDENGRADLVLPINFNHALFARLYPETEAGVEDIDVRGGADLIRAIAEIDGLADLAELIELVETKDATVQVLSPPRIVITCCGTEPLGTRARGA